MTARMKYAGHFSVIRADDGRAGAVAPPSPVAVSQQIKTTLTLEENDW